MKRSETRQIWYISFGDMLTLLFAGFILMLSNSEDTSASANTAHETNPKQLFGTKVAILPNEGVQALLYLRDSSAFTERQGMSEIGMKKLKNIVASEAYAGSELSFEFCQPEDTQVRVRSAAAIRSQFLDALSPNQRLSRVWVSSRCSQPELRLFAEQQVSIEGLHG